nr:phage tail protein [uncultured Desulfobacter sp.]
MIDVNRQKFWMLSEPSQFDLGDPPGSVAWCSKKAHPVLRMKRSRILEHLPQNRTQARLLSNQLPSTVDAYGTWAYVEDEQPHVILGGGVFPDPIEIVTLAETERVVDMSMNPEGVLYVISRDETNVSTVYMINLTGSIHDGKNAFLQDEEIAEDTRMVSVRFPLGDEQPDRIVALASGGALLLDREHHTFWQIVGKPVREQPLALYPPETPRPCADGPLPQELIDRPDLVLPEGFEAVDMAASPEGGTAILLFPPEADADNPAAVVLISGKTMGARLYLEGVSAPFSIGWVGEETWAVLCEDQKEAFGFTLPFLTQTPDEPVRVSGYRYPLNWGKSNSLKNARLCNGLSQPVDYPSTDKQGRFVIRPLYPLSFPSYPARVTVSATHIIDSGEPHTVWHRLLLEAHLPKGTGVVVHVAASENREDVENAPEQFDHYFGAAPGPRDAPRGTWISETSEVPFFPGLLADPPKNGRAGIFGVLIQRSGYEIRSLKGRYFKVAMTLTGGGQATPEIAALRIYYPRFSYLDRYLPELYRQTDVRQRAQIKGAASGSDFLQRFLCLFEGVLTDMENRVAAAHMLTNPTSAPAQALEWLGQWVAVSGAAILPEERKRLLIGEATALYRKRGTLKGLARILKLATGLEGNFVLLEDFRLRRTFATILGRDFDVENDPLLMAEIPNANSYLGDTLILGREEKKEFLALYGADISLDDGEQNVADNFYARLGNRLTVLVHKEADQETLGLIRRIVAAEIPAHIEFRVVPASKPLIIGLYSLLGVDTYTRPTPERRTARLGQSYLGRYDFIRKLPVLDERLEP